MINRLSSFCLPYSCNLLYHEGCHIWIKKLFLIYPNYGINYKSANSGHWPWFWGGVSCRALHWENDTDKVRKLQSLDSAAGSAAQRLPVIESSSYSSPKEQYGFSSPIRLMEMLPSPAHTTRRPGDDFVSLKTERLCVPGTVYQFSEFPWVRQGSIQLSGISPTAVTMGNVQ